MYDIKCVLSWNKSHLYKWFVPSSVHSDQFLCSPSVIAYTHRVYLPYWKFKMFHHCFVFSTIKNTELNTFLNIPTKCSSLFLKHVSITSLLHVSVCCIQFLQGEKWCIWDTEICIKNKHMHLFGILKKLFNVKECTGWKILKLKYKIFRLNTTVYIVRKSNILFG